MPLMIAPTNSMDPHHRYRGGAAPPACPQFDLETGSPSGKSKYTSPFGGYGKRTFKRLRHLSAEQRLVVVAVILLCLITLVSITGVQIRAAGNIQHRSIHKNSMSALERRQIDNINLENAGLQSSPSFSQPASTSNSPEALASPSWGQQQESKPTFFDFEQNFVANANQNNNAIENGENRESMQAAFDNMMSKMKKDTPKPLSGERRPVSQAAVAPAVSQAIKSCMNQNPIMAANEVTRLVSWLRDTDVMLEYGSASSNCVWSHFVKKLYSIDHDTNHVNMVRMFTRPNHKLVAVPLLGAIQPGVPSSMSVFKDYVELPNHLGIKFDVVLLDGRAKPQAALNAIPLLAEDGVVMMHNFHREHYFIIEDWYDVIDTHFSLAVLKPKKEYKGVVVKDPKLPSWW